MATTATEGEVPEQHTATWRVYSDYVGASRGNRARGTLKGEYSTEALALARARELKAKGIDVQVTKRFTVEAPIRD